MASLLRRAGASAVTIPKLQNPQGIPLRNARAPPVHPLGRSFHTLRLPTECRSVRTEQVATPTAQPLAAEELRGLLAMARPSNIAPSYFLVLLGAWTAGGMASLAVAGVWVMGFVSAAISSASCVVNDWFDASSGVDRDGKPGKPLLQGLVTSEHALVLAAAGYCGALMAALLIGDARTRLIVAASAAATLLYTPLLKPVCLVKNVTVAAVVAAAPLAGALAAGMAGAALPRALTPLCGFLFAAVLYREGLMDVNDLEGDEAAGVRTLPVVLGRPYALAMAAALLLVCLGIATHVAWSGTGLLWAWAAARGVEAALLRATGAACACSLVLPGFFHLWQVWRSEFDPGAVDAAVASSRNTILAGVLFIAALA